MIQIECSVEDLNKEIYAIVVNELMNQQIKNPNVLVEVDCDICEDNDEVFISVENIILPDHTVLFKLDSNSYSMSHEGQLAEVKKVPISSAKRLIDHFFIHLGIISDE